MSFGFAIGGSAGGYITPKAPAGQYASQPNGPVSGVAADDIFWQTDEVESRSGLRSLQIHGPGGEVIGFTLRARVGAIDYTLAADDTGGITTQDPASAVNQLAGDISSTVHGLPANFGPGRGRWREQDVMLVSITNLRLTSDPQGGSGQTPVIDVETYFIDPDNDGWGDPLVYIHNHGAQDWGPGGGFTVVYDGRA